MATPTLSLVDRIDGFLWNAATGTLTQAQKTNLEQVQATSVSAASGGSISYGDALSQAQGDVDTVLKSANADPSQASIFNNPGLDSLFQKAGWVIAVLVFVAIAYVGFQFWLAIRR